MLEVNKFDAIRIGIASPEKIREWSYGEVKNQKQLTIVLFVQNVMAYSVRKSLDQLKIMNVLVENIKEFVTKISYVTVVVLK